MISTKLKQIFLPAILLTILLSLSNVLFSQTQNFLLQTSFSPVQLPSLKMLAIIPQAILAITLLFFARTRPFEKIFKCTLFSLIAILSILALLAFFQNKLRLPETYGPFISNWAVSLFYIASHLMSFNLTSILVWGFINRCTNLTDGKRCYIPLAFFLSFILGSTLFTSWSTNELSFPVLAISAIVCMIGAYFAFNLFWKKIPDSVLFPIEPLAKIKLNFPFLSAAYLLAGSMMVKQLLSFAFKSDVKAQSSDAAAYAASMGTYSSTLASSILFISILWALLGTWLLIKKGWGKTALYGSLSIVFGGVIFFSANAIYPEGFLFNQGVYTALLAGATGILFFPLIQVLYLYLPYQMRLKAKITTEMIALPVMESLPSLALQAIVFGFYATLNSLTPLIQILAFICTLLLVVASRRIYKNYLIKQPAAF